MSVSPLPSAAGHAGAVLASDGTNAGWTTVGGDVKGSPGSELVQGLLGVSISPTAPQNGQALVYNASSNTWQPGSGTGTAAAWPITRTSDTVLTIGSGQALSVGGTYCQVPPSAATITIGGGTGTLLMYITPACQLIVANNILVNSCTNCTAVGGTAFPPGSFPLGTWSVSGGVLAPTGVSMVTPYGIQPLTAGQNIQLTYAGGQISVSANNLTTNQRTRMMGYSFDQGGVELSPNLTKYLTVPFACTISGWNIALDQGTATVVTWKRATGSGIPTSADSISQNGVSIASGTSIHSSNLTDFTTTTINADDVFAFRLSAISQATYVNFILECLQ